MFKFSYSFTSLPNKHVLISNMTGSRHPLLGVEGIGVIRLPDARGTTTPAGRSGSRL
jgi:hypothetical protein